MDVQIENLDALDDLEQKRTLLEIIYGLRRFTKEELWKKYCAAVKVSPTQIATVEDYLLQLMQVGLLLLIGRTYVLKSHLRKLNKHDPTE